MDSCLTTLSVRQSTVDPLEANLPPHPLIGLLLRLVYQHYSQDIDAALRDAGFDGIRPPHANVFPFVPPEGIQVSELAALARVRKQTMAQAVEQLERAGYVERRPNPRDRRARLVFLTERGEAVRPVTHATAARVEERWAELTSPEEIEALRSSLQRLLTQLRSEGE
jgi:DNA-binding MarR family transcriptional regulator